MKGRLVEMLAPKRKLQDEYMKTIRVGPLFLLVLATMSTAIAQDQKLVVQQTGTWETVVAVSPTVHVNYGLSYPLTYRMTLPAGSSGLLALRRHLSSDPWVQLPERFAGEYFNGIEAVRFDYADNSAYVSVGFGDVSDSIFFKITLGAGDSVQASYDGITTHYDNREAAVTVTADDWHPDFDASFSTALSIFRLYNLYVSTAIVTEWCDSTTWSHIQMWLDEGTVEACSHGRNHLYTPYPDVEYEVGGARQDIIDNLTLPPNSRYGDREYVPIWVAPYGEYDEEIEAAVSNNKYLVSRLVSWEYDYFSSWNEELQTYDPIGVVHEMGPLWGGITDTVELNGDFDEAVAEGGVYHVMCHPHVLADQWDEAYPWAHLRHISNRPNLWYVNLGHLYMYRLLQDPGSTPSTHVTVVNQVPTGYTLAQNYPNPFNPTTTIQFSIAQSEYVNIKVFDMLGREVAVLVSDQLYPGTYTATWTARNVSSGAYAYRMQAGKFVSTKRFILLK